VDTVAPQPYVFVSYASADRERVLAVVAALQSAGVRCWVDQHAIEAGANWGQEIADAIAGCAAFALMSSAASLTSRNVRQEIALAWKHGKPYLPLLLDPTPIPREIEYFLEMHQWVEVLEHPDAVWLPRVTRALERLGPETEGGGRDAGFGMRDWEPGLPPPVHRPASRTPNTEHRTPSTAPRPRHRVKPFLVGREAEQARLEEWLGEATEGRGRLVLVGGEAGIGKTTLTSWLLWLAEERGALVRVGGCYDLTTTPPYGPWGEILRGWPGAEAGVPEVPVELREGTGMGNVQSQAAFFTLAGDFFAAAAAARPLVLLLEDLHWSDQASLDFLRYAARLVADAPLLLVCTWREDELTRRHPLFALLPALAREPHARRLTLSRLDAPALAALVVSRYDLPDSDTARVVDYVQRLTDGNPFFAGEVLRAVEEAGALARDGDRWRLTRLEQLHVPALVRQVIEGRLTRLGEDTRRLLEVAAVIGHEAPLDLWVEVSDEDDALLAEALERATEARLLDELPNRTHVRFTHALVRETLYEGLVSLRRRAWHRRVADALIAGPRPSPDAVAGHLLAAGDGRAFDWLVQAGDRARARFAGVDAIQRYEQAVALIADDESRAQERGWLLYRIGVLLRGSNPRRGIAYMDGARELGRVAADRTLEAYATFIDGQLHMHAGEPAAGMRKMRVGAELAEQLTAADLERSGLLLTSPYAEVERVEPSWLPDYMEINPVRGTVLQFLGLVGRPRDAIAQGEAFVALADGRTLPPPSVHAVSDALHGLMLASSALGNVDAGRRSFERAIDGYRSIGHFLLMSWTVQAHFFTLHWHYNADDPLERAYLQRIETEAEQGVGGATGEEAVQPFAQFIDDLFADRWDEIVRRWTHEQQSLMIRQAVVLLPIGQIARQRGDREQAWAAIAGYVPPDPDDEHRIGSAWFDAGCMRFAVTLHLDDRDLAGAESWLQAYDLWLERSGAVLGRAEGSLYWARYHQIAGDPAQARQHAEGAIAHAADPRQPLALVAAHRSLGQLLTEAGEHTDAASHLRESLAIAEAIGIRSEFAWTQLALAELHAARGEAEAARALLAEVRAVFEPLGAVPTLERAEALEARLSS
jgi:tetratricopeptide (TPR) repeat protein